MSWAKGNLPRLALIAVLLAGLWVRLDYARSALTFQGDENTVALMALHIARGEDFPLYFYGQRYMGGIAPCAIAAAFLVMGPTDLAVCAGMLPFSLLWMWALYLLFGRLIGRWAGVVAAAAVAFGPPELVHIGVAPWIGYVPTFAYGALILYFGVRLNDGDLSSRAALWSLVAMGALAGLSIWTNPLCLPYLIVGFGLLVAHVVRRRRQGRILPRLGAGLLAFLVTVCPVIITGMRYGIGALFGFRPSRLSLVPDVLRITFDRYIPETFGVWGGNVTALSVVSAVCVLGPIVALLVQFVVAVVRRNRRIVRGALVPLLFVLVFLPFYLTNPLAAKYNPRYFLAFYPLVVTAFAFPLAVRRAWLTGGVLAVGTFLVVGNLLTHASICAGKPAEWARLQRAACSRIVQDVEGAGLRYVMEDSDEWHAFTWAARERVIFVKPWAERYYPHLAGAVADDDAGFMFTSDAACTFRATLETLDVTADELAVDGRTIFHRFVLPTTQLELVEPAAVTLHAGDTSTSVSALTDHDEETILGRAYAEPAALTLDMGKPVAVAALRFVAPNEWDYPAGYVLAGSNDGVGWTVLQRVEKRAATACIYGNRLFHRGLDTAMECRFSSEPVRYLRLDELRAPAEHVAVWRFSELYVYAAAGQRPRPDAHEADEIAQRLRGARVDFAFCDPWLSARISARTTAGPQVLPYYSLRHPHTHLARRLPLRKGVAVVVEHAHADQVRRLLTEATLGEISLDTVRSDNYTACIITDAPDGYESFPGLKWNGFTLTQTARIATAARYHERGVQLDEAGRREDALRCFRRSFETYDGIIENLRALADEDAHARELLDAYTPDHETRCRFPYGISLVGYTLDPSTLVAGESATLHLVWQLEGNIPYDHVPVFVHFVDGATIRFQADHNAVFPFPGRTTVPRCLVLDEHTFTVPADCPQGELTIRLGALTWWDRSTRLKPRTKLKTRDRAVEIGTVEVTAQ